MVKGKCEYCGAEIYAKSKSLLHRFCSKRCGSLYWWDGSGKRAEQLVFHCANCGREVLRDKHDWRFKRGIKLVFCSNDCHTEYSRAHRTPNVCEWCGKEFMHKHHNTKYCCEDCKHMNQRLLAYRRFHDPNITKEDFVSLYESSNPFVFAGREKQYYKDYVKTNKDRLFSTRKKKLQENPIEAYALKIKKQIQAVYARKQKSVGPKLFAILGCQAPQFIEHINSLLHDGMTIENYGLWQLDHIIPLSSAKTIEEVDKLCHYTNYQPLWREDNRKKGKKKPGEPI